MTPRYHLILTMRAADEMEAIFDFIREDSPHNASALIAGIVEAIDNLAYFPFRTIVAGGSAKGRLPLRSLPMGNYLVFFRVNQRTMGVTVVRVRHGARKRRA